MTVRPDVPEEVGDQRSDDLGAVSIAQASGFLNVPSRWRVPGTYLGESVSEAADLISATLASGSRAG